MKTLIRVITAAAICLAAQSAFSQTTFGAPTCGQWLADKSTVMGAVRQTWLTGYLSGINIGYLTWANIKNQDPLDRLSSMAAAYAWMDNWCRKNPLEGVDDGGQALFIELIKKDTTRK